MISFPYHPKPWDELADNVVSHSISAVWKYVAEISGQWWMESSAVAPDGNDGEKKGAIKNSQVFDLNWL